MRKKINYGKLVSKLKSDKDQITFLQEHGIFHSSVNCEGCGKVLGDLKKHSTKKYYYFHCQQCKKMVSIRSKSILRNANISLRKFVLLVYIFIANFWSYRQVQVLKKYCIFFLSVTKEETDLTLDDETDEDSSVLSKATINKYYTMFRDVIGIEMVEKRSNDKIGGVGLHVEIDERNDSILLQLT